MNKVLEVFLNRIQKEFSEGYDVVMTNLSIKDFGTFIEETGIHSSKDHYYNIPLAILQYIDLYFQGDEKRIVPISFQGIDGDVVLFLLHPGETAQRAKRDAKANDDLLITINKMNSVINSWNTDDEDDDDES